MRILLVSVPILDWADDILVPIAMDRKKIAPPYGIYLLSAVLKEAGHDIQVLDLIAEGTKELGEISSKLGCFDLIGIGATTFSWPTARDVIQEIRRFSSNIPIVVGGIHATMFDQYILETTAATFVIRGEAEHSLVELCEALMGQRILSDVTNLTFRDSDGIIIRNPISRVVDLSKVPLPDYGAMPSGKYAGLSIESSRGCPFDCIFCSTSYRKSYRSLDPIIFLDRLEALLPFLDKTVAKTIHVVDDEFALNHRRIKAFIKEINRRNLRVKLVFDTRATDLLDSSFVELLAPFVGKFLVGAECGYDTGLKLIGKKTTTNILEQAAANLHEHGIAHLADFSFIIGLPWETYEETLQTISFSNSLLVKYGVNILLQWYLQVPGSRLWHEQRKDGIVHEALYDDYGIFRNTYLFRTGIPFKLEDYSSISEIVTALRMIHTLSGVRRTSKIEYAHPLAIRRYFPIDINIGFDTSGLNSLRELSASTRGIR